APAAPDDEGAATDAGASLGSAEADSGADTASAAPPTEALPFVGPVPEEKSKPPTPAEWNAAKDMKIVPPTRLSCTARRVREWMQIRCQVRDTVAIEVVTGLPRDVYFSIRSGAGECSSDDSYGTTTCADIDEVVFAIRRGDRRVLQITQAGQSYGGSTREAVSIIS